MEKPWLVVKPLCHISCVPPHRRGVRHRVCHQFVCVSYLSSDFYLFLFETTCPSFASILDSFFTCSTNKELTHYMYAVRHWLKTYCYMVSNLLWSILPVLLYVSCHICGSHINFYLESSSDFMSCFNFHLLYAFPSLKLGRMLAVMSYYLSILVANAFSQNTDQSFGHLGTVPEKGKKKKGKKNITKY